MWQWRSLTVPLRFLSLFCLSLTLTTLPGCLSSSPPKPFSSEVSPTDPVAEIVEIRDRPVWVRFLNSNAESSARVGTQLQVGETIRTEDSARVQILLKSGVVVRIEGNSELKLEPNDLLSLTRGRMLAWVSPDRKQPAQIQTPEVVASLRDSTLYLDIPVDKMKDRNILALQGGAEVKLNNASTPIKLEKGQNLTIKANGITSEPKTLDAKGVEKLLADSKLLIGFNSSLASLSSIESTWNISSNVKDPEKILVKRSQTETQPKKEIVRRDPEPSYQEPAPSYREPTKQRTEAPVETQPSAKNPAPAPSAAARSRVAAPADPPPPPAQPVAEPAPLPAQPEVSPAEPPPLPVQPETQNQTESPPQSNSN